jgi:hypothetical protein
VTHAIVTRQGGLGNILDDLSALASAFQSYSSTGSMGPWIGQQITAFNQLPNSVTILQQQIASVSQVFSTNGVLATGVGDDVTQAGTLLAGVVANYPAASAQLNALTVRLLPIMSKLYVGNMDADVVQVLTANATETISTMHVITGLLADRDRAQLLVQQAAANPTLSPTIRDQALSALANASGSAWLKYVLYGGAALFILKKVF